MLHNLLFRTVFFCHCNAINGIWHKHLMDYFSCERAPISGLPETGYVAENWRAPLAGAFSPHHVGNRQQSVVNQREDIPRGTPNVCLFESFEMTRRVVVIEIQVRTRHAKKFYTRFPP